MALQSLLTTNPSKLHFSPLYSSPSRRSLLPVRPSVAGISGSAHASRRPVLRAMEPANGDAASSSQDDAKVTYNGDLGSSSSKSVNPATFPIPNIPPWAKWVIGSVILLAIPFYKKLIKIEGGLAKTAEMVTEAVEKAAEITDKVAEKVEAILPEGSLKELVKKVEKAAEAVDKGAELAESIVHKVEGEVDELDKRVEPIIEEGEVIIARGRTTKVVVTSQTKELKV